MIKRLLQLVENYHGWLAGAILLLMTGLGLASMAGDSGIVDEVAHIPAGYSYVKYGDYRLNPEHPPLLKDLAGVPLLFMDVEFPTDIPAWTTDVNGQWESGWHFIYHRGNDADAILFWSRLPLLLLSVGFGWIFYRFTLKRFGHYAALLAVFLYALSPNVIAHARLVTTDMGATIFIFLAFMAFLRYLEKPGWKTLMVAALALAGAQLAKFSAVLLLPFFGLMALVFVLIKAGRWRHRLWRYGFGYLAVLGLAGGLIWLFYIPHVWNLPLVVQDRLIEGSLHGGWVETVSQWLIGLNDLPGLKALAQYILGVLMVFNRVGGGNTTYFLGEVTNQSFVWYFPLTFLIKTPIASLILMALSGFYALGQYLRHTPFKVWTKFKSYARQHYLELFSLLFIAFYTYTSVTGNLNLGIRHLLPLLPFIFMLVGKKISELATQRRWLAPVVGGLLVFYLYSALASFPSYIAYFNELIGGPANADKYTSDSSVDWGQDLKRLAQYVAARPEIKEVAVDYFGGGEPKYYFCDRRTDPAGRLISEANYDCRNSVYRQWHAENGLPTSGYIAVSETFLMNDIYWSTLRGDNGYAELRSRQPVAKIGYSIYLYKLD
ncbi:glycosyltransferase family 39 protein [Candidatus Microgenomates bacterium]|nr:glycosyltransferase family 39 protein [Candidatus Microgenomates bacterium]